MNGLPKCYRCKSQPCECKDGITLYHCGKLRDVVECNRPEGCSLQAGLTTSTSIREVYTWLIQILSSASVSKQESGQDGIGPASVARMSLSAQPVGSPKVTSRQPSTSPSVSGLVQSIMPGGGKRYLLSLGGAVQNERIPTCSRAKTAERNKPSDTTLTETRRTTHPKTSRGCAAAATWTRMGG